MRTARYFLLMIAWFGLTIYVAAQPTLPPRFDDLPKLAANWPPAWGALVRAVTPPRDDFEKDVLARVTAQLQAEPPTNDDYQFADIVLTATLRLHLSVRRAAPRAVNPAHVLQIELQERLANLRCDWLVSLQKKNENEEALKRADQWLPTAVKGTTLRPAILQLWIHQAKVAFEKSDYAVARTWLDRIEATFNTALPADDIRKSLRERADVLLKESAALPDAQAIAMLKEALTLWPRLPEGRDTLERRKQTYRTLRVAVRTLPEQLSPATAWTEVEKQTLELLFDRLYHVEFPAPLGKRYRPQLAAALPDAANLSASISLHRDAYWSSGERLTAADLRHTAFLMNQADTMGHAALWRDYLEVPRLEGNPFHLNIGYRQGLFDPLAPLTFWILPQYYHGKQLNRADDPAFAKAPVGSGPFQYVGRKMDAGKPTAVFQANAYDLRRDLGSLREIRMSAWDDPRKDLTKPLPHLALDVPTDQMQAFKELGYTELKINDSACVHFLAVNQRRPSLSSASIRRAIAHGIDRQALLNRHFRGGAMKEKYHVSARGLFPRESWASCPAPRVPEELYQPELARSYALTAKKDANKVAWTLKYPDGDPHVKQAFDEMAQAISALFQEAKIEAKVQPVGLPPHALQKALQERDYDLLYTSADNLDDPVRLALLFDPSPDAMRPGGSNFLGCDNAKLQQLLHASLQYRQFTVLQENMHAVHVHLYETMPAIPLWQLDLHVMVHSSLDVLALDSPNVFAKVQKWKFVR